MYRLPKILDNPRLMVVIGSLLVGGCAHTQLPTIIHDTKYIHSCLPEVQYSASDDMEFVTDLGSVDEKSSVIARLRDYENMRAANQRCLNSGGEIAGSAQ